MKAHVVFACRAPLQHLARPQQQEHRPSIPARWSIAQIPESGRIKNFGPDPQPSKTFTRQHFPEHDRHRPLPTPATAISDGQYQLSPAGQFPKVTVKDALSCHDQPPSSLSRRAPATRAVARATRRASAGLNAAVLRGGSGFP